MDPVLVGAMGFLLLIVLVFLGVPVGISMIIPALAGLFYLVGFDAACKLFTLHTFRFASSYDFGAVPLFLMMGYMAMYAGLTGSAYDSARVWLNRLPGGLAMATCVASGFFGACCGSGIPAMAAFSRIAIPEMLRHKYDKGLASGTVASSATLAVLIPPSIIMVIYALLTEVSLGKMLLAGYLPGALSIFIYMAMIGIRVHFNPRLAPSSGETFTWRQRLAALKGIWGIFVLFAILMGGIYTGFFTATEAAAGGAFAAVVIMVLTGKFNRSNFLHSLSETLVINAMTFLMMAGAAIFTVFMEVSNLPAFVTTWVINQNLSPFLFLTVVVVLYLFLGCFLPSVAMILITMPVLLPVLIKLKIDLIWFGIIVVKMVEVGAITPPFGLSVYVVKGVVGDTISMSEIFRGIGWFFVMEMLIVVILMAFPEISLWLPYAMKGK